MQICRNEELLHHGCPTHSRRESGADAMHQGSGKARPGSDVFLPALLAAGLLLPQLCSSKLPTHAPDTSLMTMNPL